VPASGQEAGRAGDRPRGIRFRRRRGCPLSNAALLRSPNLPTSMRGAQEVEPSSRRSFSGRLAATRCTPSPASGDRWQLSSKGNPLRGAKAPGDGGTPPRSQVRARLSSQRFRTRSDHSSPTGPERVFNSQGASHPPPTGHGRETPLLTTLEARASRRGPVTVEHANEGRPTGYVRAHRSRCSGPSTGLPKGYPGFIEGQ